MRTGVARRVLVAGIGNVFLGDDGFGVEVVGRIDAATLPSGVEVTDYGIRGVHLCYDLLDGRYDSLILVDAVPLEGPAGTLAVLDVSDAPDGAADTADMVITGDADDSDDADDPDELPVPAIDGHGLDPQAVLRLLRGLGGSVERVLVVGCRPALIVEHMGLSEPVTAAVEQAVRLVVSLALEEASRPPATRRTAAGVRNPGEHGISHDGRHGRTTIGKEPAGA